jgi:lipopolysaccharide biosynthesis regulator YciM
LLRKGAGNHAEIAYAAIVSGYYDDPLMLECVREMLTIDSDLRDMAAAFVPMGGEMTRDQLRSIAGALRNVVLRHARYKCSECGLDSSTFLWHCPGCHSWDTLRGVAALEFLPRAARPRSPAP